MSTPTSRGTAKPQESMDQRLRSLLDLPFGWGGDDEWPIGTKAVEALAAASFVPLSNGGVQVEWHRKGWDVELVVNAEGDLVSLFWERS